MHMLAALDLATGRMYYRVRQRERRREFLWRRRGAAGVAEPLECGVTMGQASLLG